MPQIANKYLYLILALVITISFLCADGLHVINYPPRSIHQWRQSDCAAYAKTYYYKNSGLFTPSTYNLAGKDGRVISEFPIIYYISAKLFHVFGLRYAVVRGLTFLCFFIGLCYLLSCIRLWIKKPIPAIFPVIILATSPFFYYYALNFLPNVPAISFSFVGLYYFLRYQRSGSNKYLWIGTLVIIFSSLLKPTDGTLVWFAWLGVAGIHIVFKKKDPLFNVKLIPIIISTAFIFASIYGWYKFANWYNDTYGNHQNLLGIYPIWDISWNDIGYTITRMTDFWLKGYQQYYIMLFLGLMFITYLIKWKKLDSFLRLFTLFVILGAFAYDILWFKAFAVHDYYHLVNVIPPVFICLSVFEYYERVIAVRINTKLRNTVAIVLALMMVLSIYHNRNIQHERYTDPIFVYINPDLYKVEPYLRKIGVRQQDAVVCVPDPSPNMSLTAISNKGYTESFNGDGYNIINFQKMGAAYLIISDSSYLHKPLYQPFTTKLIGRYNGIYIFDIR